MAHNTQPIGGFWPLEPWFPLPLLAPAQNRSYRPGRLSSLPITLFVVTPLHWESLAVGKVSFIFPELSKLHHIMAAHSRQPINT